MYRSRSRALFRIEQRGVKNGRGSHADNNVGARGIVRRCFHADVIERPRNG
jgi:hypothetical protein